MTPRIIHIIYFPWDQNHKLKPDEHDFDHGPYYNLCQYAPDFEVRLWTYSVVAALCKEHYPEVWSALQHVDRPVMMVDVLRWVVVHRFGGLYWQMNTTPLVRMEAFLPSAGKEVRLFTEFDLNPEQCRRAMSEPIRRGEPEEPKRVLIGAFSGAPGAQFVTNIIQFLLQRVQNYRPKKDYDILFITGNAAASTAYDRFGQNDPGVELIDLTRSRRMMKLHYQGAWRTDRTEARPTSGLRPRPLPPSLSFWNRRFRDVYFRYVKIHPHEALFGKQTGSKSERALEQLLPFIRQHSVSKVVEVTDAALGMGGSPNGLQVISVHPSRTAIDARKREDRAARYNWRHINLFYSTIPPGHLFICPNYLEGIGFSEALRILARIEAAKFRFLAFSDFPLLDRNWDGALGDFRPLNLRLAPFGFREPVATVPWPNPEGRPDRRLAVWELPLRP